MADTQTDTAVAVRDPQAAPAADPAAPGATVVVKDAHVKYRVYHDRDLGLREMVTNKFQRREHSHIHALKGVSFTAYHGEAIGIIGRNGTGKSTLMRAIAGSLPVTQGSIEASSQPVLLGVSAALNGNLTGRRNILVGGLALGLRRSQVSELVDPIIEYSGLEEAIDRPLRTYSSGMRARLQFAISTAVRPEILLIDEALAVGDADFKDRSHERITELRESAGPVFLVSHSLSEIRKTCTRVLWFDLGELIMDGDPVEVTQAYREAVNTASSTGQLPRPVPGRGGVLTLDRFTLSNFTVPGSQRDTRNFLVQVAGSYGEKHPIGFGEAQPRGSHTGDNEHSWAFAQDACDDLVGRKLPVTSAREAVRSVTEVMADLSELAYDRAGDDQRKPFRGTRAGIEAALLDTVARAMQIPLVELLGQQHEAVQHAGIQVKFPQDLERARTALEKRTERYPVTRLIGSGSVDEDVAFMELASQINSDHKADKPLWIQFRRTMNRETASAFVGAVASAMANSTCTDRVIIEQPVGAQYGDYLPVLQREADEACLRLAPYRALDLRIMASDSVWDIHDIRRLNKQGGCRALIVRPARSGGLLPALKLAREALKHNPDTLMAVGALPMIADVASWTLRHFALAMPRIDLYTGVPPQVPADQRLTDPVVTRAEGMRLLIDTDDPGIGAQLLPDRLAPYVQAQVEIPQP